MTFGKADIYRMAAVEPRDSEATGVADADSVRLAPRDVGQTALRTSRDREVGLQDALLRTFRAATQPRHARSRFDQSRYGI
jgi:hypothetical protein